MNTPKADFTETLIRSRDAWKGSALQVREDSVRLSNGSEVTREYILHPGAAMVIPYRDGQVMMVYQYRHPVRAHVLEFPAGKLNPGEDPETAALRELREETGIRAGEIEKIYTLQPSVATSSEILHFYLAQGLVEGEQHLDEGELLVKVWLTLSKAEALIASGEVKDPKSILGILYTIRRFGVSS